MNDTSASLANNPRWTAYVLLLGGAVLMASLAWLGWTLWAGYPPSLPRLTPMAGTIQTITFNEDRRGRMMEMTIEEHGRVQQLVLEEIGRLPLLDWPLESLHPGDRVVAWTAPNPLLSASQQEIWRLETRRHRVVSYEERSAARSNELRPMLILGFVGLVAGASLVAGALMRRRRKTGRQNRLTTAM